MNIQEATPDSVKIIGDEELETMDIWKSSLQCSEQLEAFLNFIRAAQEEYSIAQSIEAETNNQTQDLLHRLELISDGNEDLIRLSKAVKVVKCQRREAKDAQNKIVSILDWAQDNRKVLKQLEQVLGCVRRAETSTQNRHYISKTDIVEKTIGET